jgi:excisionase family DNA binding protein
MQKSILLENISTEDLFTKIRDIVTEIIDQKLKPDSPKEYLTKNETAAMLRISLPTLNRLTHSGKIKSYRIQRRILYRTDEIELALNVIDTLKYKRN